MHPLRIGALLAGRVRSSGRYLTGCVGEFLLVRADRPECCITRHFINWLSASKECGEGAGALGWWSGVPGGAASVLDGGTSSGDSSEPVKTVQDKAGEIGADAPTVPSKGRALSLTVSPTQRMVSNSASPIMDGFGVQAASFPFPASSFDLGQQPSNYARSTREVRILQVRGGGDGDGLQSYDRRSVAYQAGKVSSHGYQDNR